MKTLGQLGKMYWGKVRKEVDQNAHLYLFSREPQLVEMAETYARSGLEPALAVLCAYCYMADHGSKYTLGRAISIYEMLVKQEKVSSEACRMISELSCNAAWSVSGRVPEKLNWPRAWAKKERKAGLANIMIYVAAKDLINGTASDAIAAWAANKFLTGLLEVGKKIDENKAAGVA